MNSFAGTDQSDVLREQILRALRRNNGRRREAAAELFMSERTLYRKSRSSASTRTPEKYRL